jgi:hypothetical protein
VYLENFPFKNFFTPHFDTDAYEGALKNEFDGLTIICAGSTNVTDGSVCITQYGMDVSCFAPKMFSSESQALRTNLAFSFAQ